MPYDILIDDLGFELDDDAESELRSPFNEYGELIEWEDEHPPEEKPNKKEVSKKEGLFK
ncbi:MAG: hypothetical protein WC157_02535 [Candidatus Paceibacterota bacterium]